MARDEGDGEAAQAALMQIYRERWPALVDALGAAVRDRGLSKPQLVDLNAFGGSYWRASVRLFVVGQQTNGWDDKIPWDPDPSRAVPPLLQMYADFELGRSYWWTAFWAGSHCLCRQLSPDGPANGFVWSNLVKVDKGGRRPGRDIEDVVCSEFGVLPEEIRLARPDVVVFFTGPYYDDRLRATFSGCEFVEVSGWPDRRLATLKHRGLPARSYRTYHPGAMPRREELRPLIDEVVRLAGGT